jgi:mono/diheme cytochrome c family protein
MIPSFHGPRQAGRSDVEETKAMKVGPGIICGYGSGGVRRLSCVSAVLALVTIPIVLATFTAHAADDFAYERRLYLDKAQCSYCHGWAADGAGEPQSNGGAANLRDSRMNRDQLIEVIMCGRPATPMPHFDELAYTDKRCYGLTEAELGTHAPALPPGATLQKREAAAIADYLLAKVIGRGVVTREECEEAFGQGARSCGQYPAKQ